MMYRPPEPRSLWGFWTIEWQGTVHIFYDEDINADYDLLSWQKTHDHIGHAISEDLVHWEHRPSICAKGAPGEWNDMAQGGGVKTGCIAHHEGKFYLFAGASKDAVQVVGLWLSDDMENWEQHPDNPVLKPAGPHYLDAPTDGRPSVGWRDPGIAYCREDGCYHAFLSAQLAEKGDQNCLGSVVGHVRSRDLVHWEHLPPVATPGLADRFYQIEEPEMCQIGGRCYLLLDGGTTGGMRTSTPARDDVRGSFYMIGESFDGPFVRPEDDLLVGNDLGARCATAGRITEWQGEPVFLHFSIARRPALSPPKKVRVRADGTLYLEYMPVMEKLETGLICGSTEDLPDSSSPDVGRWHRSDGVLSGEVTPGGSVYRIADEITDLHFACSINAPSAGRAGVVLRIDKTGDAGVWPRGVGVVLDFDEQRIFISDAKSYPTTGWYCKPHDICRMPLARDRSYHLRCFARDEHLEVYLDNRWAFTTVIPEAAKAGAVELMIECGEAAFSDVRLASIEPPA